MSSRLQLALNVNDIDQAVAFYSKLFGTEPAKRRPGYANFAIAAARRHRLPMRRLRPRHISDVRQDGDLVITVCDLAHEELGRQAAVHWSVPDPVVVGTRAAFDATVGELRERISAVLDDRRPPR